MLDIFYKFLSSVGFDEPLHPPITHMPIGLSVGALIFFLVALSFKRQQLILTARHASILAFIFVFPTILFGVMDWIHYYNATLYVPIKIKIVLASVALILLGTGIIIGSEIKLHSYTMTIIYALTLISMVGLGYFGAGIIYGRGLEMKISKKTTQTTTDKAAANEHSKKQEMPSLDSNVHNSFIPPVSTDSIKQGQ